MATVLYPEKVVPTTDYEKGMKHRFGITDETCGSKYITMAQPTLPPGKRSRAHYHVYAALCTYVISGRMKVLIGPPGMIQEEYEVGPGTFIYIPEGEIHTFQNLSDTEPVEMVVAYNAPNGPATGKFYVEPPVNE